MTGTKPWSFLERQLLIASQSLRRLSYRKEFPVTVMMPEQGVPVKINLRRRTITPQRAAWIKQTTAAPQAPNSYTNTERPVAPRPLSSADWNTWSEGARGGVIAGAVIVFVFLVAIIIYAVFQRRKAACPQRSRRMAGRCREARMPTLKEHNRA